MTAKDEKAKAATMTKLSAMMFMFAAVGFMVAALLNSRNGRSPATYIALGAVFIALGGGAARRAKAAASDENDKS